MPKVPFTAFFQGPLAVYPSPTAQTDPVTGGIYLGTDFLEGNYADVSNEDTKQWNQSYGTQLKGGRYRICRLATNAIAANLAATAGQGSLVGWAQGTVAEAVVIANGGTGYTNGTFNVVSTYNIGSQQPVVAQVTVSGGIIISAGLVQPGGPFFATPTFSLSELSGGSGASVLAQLAQNSAWVSSFDSTSGSVIGRPRGVCYAAPTTAQIQSGAWVVVQESGIAQVYVDTATGTAVGDQLTVATGGNVTSQTTAAFSALEVGYALAKPTAGVTVPTVLTLPTVED